jgi:broad specificity polyphosphatase/5'/3'-nucleotidase SurE
LIDHLLQQWSEQVHVYNINVPLTDNVSTTKIFFTRLLENQSGSLFRLLSPRENHFHEKSKAEAAKAEQRLREDGSAKINDIPDDKTDWHDESDMLSMDDIAGIKRWQWSMNFKGMEEFVEEHGAKGGGMTDGWALNRGWVSVTALRAAFQVVDGGAGGTHGGEEIKLEKL